MEDEGFSIFELLDRIYTMTRNDWLVLFAEVGAGLIVVGELIFLALPKIGIGMAVVSAGVGILLAAVFMFFVFTFFWLRPEERDEYGEM